MLKIGPPSVRGIASDPCDMYRRLGTNHYLPPFTLTAHDCEMLVEVFTHRFSLSPLHGHPTILRIHVVSDAGLVEHALLSGLPCLRRSLRVRKVRLLRVSIGYSSLPLDPRHQF